MSAIHRKNLAPTASPWCSRKIRRLPLRADVPLLTRFKGFDDLPTCEQVDIIAACFKLGVSACDFEFSMIEDSSPSAAAPARRIAHIALRDGAYAQSYLADDGVEWITLFIFDFSMGRFET
jgi:hypothetical protein